MVEKKYFGTDGVRGKFGVYPITCDFVIKLGYAAGKVLAQNGGVALIGRDTRQSGDLLSAALFIGFSNAGVNIIDLGIVPTPAVAILLDKYAADLGLVISASHNPYVDNGIKIFSKNGEKISDQYEYEIEELIDSLEEIPNSLTPGIKTVVENANSQYLDCLSSKITLPDLALERPIIVDCANGAMCEVVNLLSSKLSVDIKMIHASPNGLNINEKCGAVDVKSLRESVIDNKAQMGVAFDGDGDRITIISSDGEIIDGDSILFILAIYFKRIGYDFKGVVGTIMSNLGVENAFKEMQIPFARSKVGDRYVIDLMNQFEYLLGGEQSGHIICKLFNTTGDALAAFILFLCALNEYEFAINSLLRKIKKLPQIMENVKLHRKFLVEDYKLLDKNISNVEARLGSNGRVVLRPSGTENLLRIMIECKDEKKARKEVDYLVECVKDKILNR